jgi:O-methyltransferase
MVEKILSFHNIQIDSSIISREQIECLITHLLQVVDKNIEGDVVELGCYVGESSKYLTKTLMESGSNKRLYVYDSFDGLPELTEWEKSSGWQPGTLKTTEEVLISNFKQNNLPVPNIHKDWFKDIPDYKIPETISFAFLDGDFYNSIYDSLTKVFDKVVEGGYILFHDFRRPDLPGVDAAIKDFLKERGLGYNVVEVENQIGLLIKDSNFKAENEISSESEQPVETTSEESEILTSDVINPTDNKITLVTGLWNIGRENLENGWSRSYEHYIEKFRQLLSVEENMIIFGDDELQKIVFEIRTQKNTQFILRDLNWFKRNDYYEKIQKIRVDPKWYGQSGWLPESTQARLEMYNPLVMSKVFLLHDAKILDRFNSDYMFWIDAGLSNTVHPGYFTHDKVLNKLPNLIKDFHFICFPYEANNEIHGFDYNEMVQYCDGAKVNKVARAGFFGGKKDSITQINAIYYSLLNETLSKGLMGTEESLFTIMVYKYPELIGYSEIEDNGLMGKFFEDLKNSTIDVKVEKSRKFLSTDLELEKTAVYVITFNSPKQFETLIDSMLLYDADFINKPKKYLLNNSTDNRTTPRYDELCERYGFEHIKKDNLGICGGRQFIAEHFEATGYDYYFFFEDDMFFYAGEDQLCRNGFPRYVKNIFQKSLQIANKENFDFLKFNFSEFYGDNSTQWAWYNVPQTVREKFWPHYSKLPEFGTDPNAPKLEFKNIKSLDGVSYATGDVYYCNWPQVLSREGSKKMFLEEKWAHPYEQTWMSYMFQEVKKGSMKFGLLLASPTEHDRFDHYDGKLRKES